MAAAQRKLVHKQFNSPIGLYSQQNVKETLDRELKAFGTDGIEIDEQIAKPLNLANSAVLRAVEEEEQQVKCGYKRVAWPPASEERIVREFTPQPNLQSQSPTGQYYSQQQPQQPTQGPIYNNVQAVVPQTSPSQLPQSYQQQHAQPQQQQHQQQHQPIQYTQAHFNSSYELPPTNAPNQPQLQPQSPQQQQNIPVVEAPIAGWKQIRPPLTKSQNQYQSSLGTVGSAATVANQHQQQTYRASSYEPQQYQQPLQSQIPTLYNQQQYSPPNAQHLSQQPGWEYQQRAQQQYQPQPQPLSQDQPDNAYQPLPQEYRGGSPGIITLRKETPVSQKAAPIYNAQPAAISYQGSKLRGDLKWPPPEYKEAAARENEERRKLALGPVCRPRKVNRDFSSFFAKNALNSYYPTYKVPPGTQHMLA